MGYRIQHNNAISPYKGGIVSRFCKPVDHAVPWQLEQTFKELADNSAIGRWQRGSDFSPRGKSNAEIMRFCQAFMLELWRHIGPGYGCSCR